MIHTVAPHRTFDLDLPRSTTPDADRIKYQRNQPLRSVRHVGHSNLARHGDWSGVSDESSHRIGISPVPGCVATSVHLHAHPASASHCTMRSPDGLSTSHTHGTRPDPLHRTQGLMNAIKSATIWHPIQAIMWPQMCFHHLHSIATPHHKPHASRHSLHGLSAIMRPGDDRRHALGPWIPT